MRISRLTDTDNLFECHLLVLSNLLNHFMDKGALSFHPEEEVSFMLQSTAQLIKLNMCVCMSADIDTHFDAALSVRWQLSPLRLH